MGEGRGYTSGGMGAEEVAEGEGAVVEDAARGAPGGGGPGTVQEPHRRGRRQAPALSPKNDVRDGPNELAEGGNRRFRGLRGKGGGLGMMLRMDSEMEQGGAGTTSPPLSWPHKGIRLAGPLWPFLS